MRFLMLVLKDAPFPDDAQSLGEETERWVETMDRRGVRVAGDPLAPPGAAAVVRVRDGETRVTHGAFLDVGDALLGFDLLECADIDEAVEVAAAHPLAKFCALEIRSADND
jgi:hypothetical protein